MNDSIPLYGSQNNTYSQTTWTHAIGKRNYELSNHLGNVLSVISDKPILHGTGDVTTPGTVVDYFMSDILQSTDYSAFGVQLSGRNLYKTGAKESRFGFQGQEEDDEIKGEGNSVNYTFRMHDPRLGRFFAIDPLIGNYPHYTPYSFSGNKVIMCVELEGMEEFIATLSPDGNNWYITWNFEVSQTEGQMGKILYQTKDKQVIEEIRDLNAAERAIGWIKERENINSTKDPRLINDGISSQNSKTNTPSTCLAMPDGNSDCMAIIPYNFQCPTSGVKPPPKLTDAQKRALAKSLTAGSLFDSKMTTVFGKDKQYWWVVADNSKGGTLDILSAYNKSALKSVKITVSLNIDGGNMNTDWGPGKTPTAMGDRLSKELTNVLVKAGFSRKNIAVNPVISARDAGGIEMKFTIK
jgi:RHS repeat-associated protein